MDDELTVYERIFLELKCDIDKWSYLELVGIAKELGYREINIIWYKDPTFKMHILPDDKCALDIKDLFKV